MIVKKLKQILVADVIVTVITVMASQSLEANLAIPVPVPEILRAMFMVSATILVGKMYEKSN